MATFEIKREPEKPRVIRMGQAVQVIEPPVEPIPQTEAPVIEKNKQGRKKMADKKLDHETGGPETIRKDDADEKGAIGSHGKNAPAQEKGGAGENKSGEEGKANG
jgi:hypothetical protein